MEVWSLEAAAGLVRFENTCGRCISSTRKALDISLQRPLAASALPHTLIEPIAGCLRLGHGMTLAAERLLETLLNTCLEGFVAGTAPLKALRLGDVSQVQPAQALSYISAQSVPLPRGCTVQPKCAEMLVTSTQACVSETLPAGQAEASMCPFDDVCSAAGCRARDGWAQPARQACKQKMPANEICSMCLNQSTRPGCRYTVGTGLSTCWTSAQTPGRRTPRTGGRLWPRCCIPRLRKSTSACRCH